MTMKRCIIRQTATALIIALVACTGCKNNDDDKPGDDEVKVTDVTLNRTSLDLTVAQNATLKATVEPEDATDPSVNWTSSKPEVATVIDGVVIAEAAGVAVIVVTTTDGGKTAVCTVTVTAAGDPEDPEDPEEPTDPAPPVLTTLTATGITATGATLGGNITSAGTPPYTRRGVCCGTAPNPTVSVVSQATGAIGKFTLTAGGLTPNTLYYARAYADYPGGRVYGNEITFTTAEPGRLAVLTTSPATEVTAGTATLLGSVTDAGNPAYTSRGFYLAVGHTPTESDTRVTVTGTGTGAFSTTVSGLTPGATYHVRAFARSTAGIGWGDELTFTTAAAKARPEVTTGYGTGVTDMRATLHGNITNAGNPAYTERGFCYGTTSNPIIANNRTPVVGSGTGPFSIEITGLQGGTLYYVRAYAISELGTVYGDVRSFSTPSRPNAPASLIAVTVSSSQIDLNWAAVTDAIGYRVQYSTNRINWAQVSSESIIEGTTCRVVGLTANTNYYFRVCSYTLNGDSGWSPTANDTTLK
jgi:hypothetical protein